MKSPIVQKMLDFLDSEEEKQRMEAYSNENGKVSFGWSLSYEGAWVNGCFSWPTPFLNPLSKTFWRFRKARKFLTNYLEEKEVKEYREKLKSVI
jgi:hypothetical protein